MAVKILGEESQSDGSIQFRLGSDARDAGAAIRELRDGGYAVVTQRMTEKYGTPTPAFGMMEGPFPTFQGVSPHKQALTAEDLAQPVSGYQALLAARRMG